MYKIYIDMQLTTKTTVSTAVANTVYLHRLTDLFFCLFVCLQVVLQESLISFVWLLFIIGFLKNETKPRSRIRVTSAALPFNMVSGLCVMPAFGIQHRYKQSIDCTIKIVFLHLYRYFICVIA